MKNNNVEIVGNICGDVRLLREADVAKNLKEKIEVIVIANDSYDKEGRPNSLRIYMYGALAEDFRTKCSNGDKVKVLAHLKRKNIKVKDCEGVPTGEIRYATEIIGENYEIVRQGSTGYSRRLKKEASGNIDAQTVASTFLSDDTSGVDYMSTADGVVVAVDNNQ